MVPTQKVSHYTFLALIVLLLSTSVNAQKIKDKNVPPSVKSSLQSKYPAIKQIEWEREDTHFEAEFEIEETEYTVVLDSTGNILETETEIDIPQEQLPSNAKDYLAKNFPNKKIKETSKITNDKGTLIFEVEIKGKELLFDAEGNFLEEEK